jgi:hypothetical protein
MGDELFVMLDNDVEFRFAGSVEGYHGYITGRLKGLQLATMAEFGSPLTGPNGELNRSLWATQASLRLSFAYAAPIFDGGV